MQRDSAWAADYPHALPPAHASVPVSDMAGKAGAAAAQLTQRTTPAHAAWPAPTAAVQPLPPAAASAEKATPSSPAVSRGSMPLVKTLAQHGTPAQTGAAARGPKSPTAPAQKRVAPWSVHACLQCGKGPVSPQAGSAARAQWVVPSAPPHKMAKHDWMSQRR